LTGRVTEDNDRIEVFRAPHFKFGNALEEKFFCGKIFGFRAQTMSTKKGERMPLQATLLTKVL